jgi:hypothetical protein
MEIKTIKSNSWLNKEMALKGYKKIFYEIGVTIFWISLMIILAIIGTILSVVLDPAMKG